VIGWGHATKAAPRIELVVDECQTPPKASNIGACDVQPHTALRFLVTNRNQTAEPRLKMTKFASYSHPLFPWSVFLHATSTTP
jgi:hypothetical protein